jgi:hypothetical protein
VVDITEADIMEGVTIVVDVVIAAEAAIVVIVVSFL